MKEINLFLVLAILLMIAFQLYRRSKLIVKGKFTVIEKSSLTISLVMVVIVTLVGSSQPMHYVIGGLLALLLISSMLKIGVSDEGIYSMSRVFMMLPWKKVHFIKLVKRNNEKDFELHSVGRTWTNVMTLDMKDFNKTMDLIHKNLKPNQYEVAHEKLVEGLREKTKKQK